MRSLSLLLLTLLAVPAPAADGLEVLLAALDAIRAETGVPACGLALVEHGETVYAGARGTADLASGRPAGPDTVFRIGSITKTFTALAVMRAVESGALRLEQPVAPLLGPGLVSNPWADAAPVRLVHLLEHTGGLGELSMEEMYHSDPAPLPLARAVRLHPENRRVLWQPGVHYSYTNAGAGLAAYALEQATGVTFEDYLAERVLEPLGIGATSLLRDGRTRAHLATGYDTDRRTPIPYWHMLFRPFGALNARPDEMAALVRMMLGRGSLDGRTVFEAAVIERMERPTTTLAARSGLAFGYGLGVYAWHRDGIRFFGHGGDGDGYLAHFGYAPEAGRGYFLVINAFTHGPLKRLRAAVERWVTRGVTRPAEPPVVAAAEGVAGRYEQATARFAAAPGSARDVLTVTRDGRRLLTRLNGADARPLLAVGPRHFRRPGEPRATIAIVPGPDGRLVFQGERRNFVRTRRVVAGAVH